MWKHQHKEGDEDKTVVVSLLVLISLLSQQQPPALQYGEFAYCSIDFKRL